MYIGYVKKMAEWLSENANHYKWQSFSDVEPILKELWSNKYTYRNKVRLLRVICQYIENGYYPMVANTTASLTTMSCSAQNTRM